eukprot:TRINITY_DN6938_c0_g1_i1.p1 TRINITY_DN6938_c0_g1~~TRINITY_DN6938_c0_g1_i1.p1  ORF type:complete len:582 (+),score=172.40 TRINITY_DN6938_c0_g1_i1:80-1747(+)
MGRIVVTRAAPPPAAHLAETEAVAQAVALSGSPQRQQWAVPQHAAGGEVDSEASSRAGQGAAPSADLLALAAEVHHMRELAAEQGEVVVLLHRSVQEQRELISNQRLSIDDQVQELAALRGSGPAPVLGAREEEELAAVAAETQRLEQERLAAGRALTQSRHAAEQQRLRRAEAEADAAGLAEEREAAAEEARRGALQIARLRSAVEGLRDELAAAQRLRQAQEGLLRRQHGDALRGLRAAVEEAARTAEQERGRVRTLADSVEEMRVAAAGARDRPQLPPPEAEEEWGALLREQQAQLERLQEALCSKRSLAATCERGARLAAGEGVAPAKLAELERISAQVEDLHRASVRLRGELAAQQGSADAAPPDPTPRPVKAVPHIPAVALPPRPAVQLDSARTEPQQLQPPSPLRGRLAGAPHGGRWSDTLSEGHGGTEPTTGRWTERYSDAGLPPSGSGRPEPRSGQHAPGSWRGARQSEPRSGDERGRWSEQRSDRLSHGEPSTGRWSERHNDMRPGLWERGGGGEAAERHSGGRRAERGSDRGDGEAPCGWSCRG